MSIEARHIDPRQRAAVLDLMSSKGHKYKRAIYFPNAVWPIVEKWCKRHPTGPVFRNDDGNRWTNSALSCRLIRLKKHTGFKLMPYALRHIFATDCLVNGVDAVTVAELMGHRDLTMVANVYGHLAKKHEYLRDQLQRGIGQQINFAPPAVDNPAEPLASEGSPEIG